MQLFITTGGRVVCVREERFIPVFFMARTQSYVIFRKAKLLVTSG